MIFCKLFAHLPKKPHVISLSLGVRRRNFCQRSLKSLSQYEPKLSFVCLPPSKLCPMIPSMWYVTD